MRPIFGKTGFLVALCALVVALTPASSAYAAGPAAIVFEGAANLPEFPAPRGNAGTFGGTIHSANAGTASVSIGAGTASELFYIARDCVTGSVWGEVWVAGVGSVPFTWQHIGATAVIQFGSGPPQGPRGAGVAVLKVTAASSTALAAACAGVGPPVAVTAQVTGAGLIVQ